MSYIENNLLSNEHVIYRGHLHWIIFLNPLFWILLAVASYYLIVYFDIYYLLPSKIFLLAIFAGAIMNAMTKWIAFSTTEFGITDKRIIVKIGFIRYRTSENFLSQVEDIQVEQTILGRILGYGNITIHGTGGTPERLRTINEPLVLRKQIQEQVEKISTQK